MGSRRYYDPIPFTPTPAEIRQGCKAIQATWSADEEPRRRAWDLAPPVTIVEVVLLVEREVSTTA